MLIHILQPKRDNFVYFKSTNIEIFNIKLNVFVQKLKIKYLNLVQYCIQETWLFDNDDHSSVKLKEYYCIPQRKYCSSIYMLQVISSFV